MTDIIRKTALSSVQRWIDEMADNIEESLCNHLKSYQIFTPIGLVHVTNWLSTKSMSICLEFKVWHTKGKTTGEVIWWERYWFEEYYIDCSRWCSSYEELLGTTTWKIKFLIHNFLDLSALATKACSSIANISKIFIVVLLKDFRMF